jgi:hypothetical protein
MPDVEIVRHDGWFIIRPRAPPEAGLADLGKLVEHLFDVRELPIAALFALSVDVLDLSCLFHVLDPRAHLINLQLKALYPLLRKGEFSLILRTGDSALIS